ncbi:methylamine utilization protein MauJ [Kiloniella sp. EL199]|uniref:methylamine utilization protein MauJ n=1 Tax=Kiloniella sp. EL199 TaxID=2107581 RepID=UPI000EA11E67|nr:methylamine utilization protein MauJ [Kiloniella sp. EL199]
MIARQLERIIENQISKFSISNQPQGHIAQRFESLRSFGLLPSGKIRNSQHLTLEQIVSGVLSIISSRADFAGHTSLIIKSLKPVGGDKVSFMGTKSLCKALETLLNINENALNSLIKVTISDSEIYTNSYCRAAIHYKVNDKVKITYYVDKNASSLFQKDAEINYNPTQITSSVINDIVFYPSFFQAINKNLKLEAARSPVQYPEEPDTSEEIETEARDKYLGITGNSNFINMGVDCQVTWPKHETVVTFDNCQIVLMPKSKEHTTSIHIDLHKNQVNQTEARNIINQFLSMLTWCDDQHAVLEEGFSGSSRPIPIRKRDLAFATAYNWIFSKKKLDNPEVKKAIAIYREGRNAEQNFLISFAVLSYYKIVEIHHKKEELKWFRENYPIIKEKLDKQVLERLERDCGDEKIEKYLSVLCRHAVAHAGNPRNINPDDQHQIFRLHTAAQVLRMLARHIIRTEMNLSDQYFD